MSYNHVMDAELPDYDVVERRFDYAALRADLQYIKESRNLTYKQMGAECYCHMQSVYKFLAGEYPTLGTSLRFRFIWFVRQNWELPYFRDQDISKPRYATEVRQYRLPNL